MPSQGVFSNTSPAPGEIRVLVQTDAGSNFVTVRSITISDTDLEGNVIVPSLSEVNKVLLPISSSGANTALSITDINDKQGYFFLNNQDIVIGDSQSSTSSSIAVDPFLIEPFFNNQYNALISNAENTRTNSLRYDVDRTSGGVNPDNFDALIGNPQVNLTLFHQEGSSKVAETELIMPTLAGSNQTVNEITSPIRQLNREGGAQVIVTLADLDNTFDSPVPPVVTIPDSFLSNSSNAVSYTVYLYLDIFTGSSLSSVSTITLLTQTNNSGTTQTVKNQTPVNIIYPTSQNKLHLRLRQKVIVNSLSGIMSIFKVGTFFGEMGRYLNISAVRGVQIPYAQKAAVQDSNYTDTGLINARYNGTKTSEADYSGISPAIAGKSFQAALYPYSGLAADHNKICSSSLADRDIETLLFDGKGDEPTVGSGLVGTILSPDVLTTASDTTCRFNPIPGVLVTEGDILLIGTEQVLVLNVNYQRKQIHPISNTLVLYPKYVRLTLQRGFDSTTAVAHANGSQLTRLGGSRLYTTEGSRIKPIGRQLVWLKDSATIVSTNDKGFIDAVKTVCTV
tara:strand:- start:14034 stop:15728 length:1695 start_codon:yes stop_codon:yes gene_type:complete